MSLVMQRVRPGRGARLRPEDRRRHAGRGAARSRRDPRLPRASRRADRDAALLEVRGPARAVRRDARCCTASTSRSSRAASPRSSAPTARARRRRCARSAAWCKTERRDRASPASASTASATEDIVRLRRRARARRPRHLRRPHGRGEPAPRRLHARATGRASRGDYRAHVRLLPAPAGAAPPAGRHAVGRRAADAGDRRAR